MSKEDGGITVLRGGCFFWARVKQCFSLPGKAVVLIDDIHVRCARLIQDKLHIDTTGNRRT